MWWLGSPVRNLNQDGAQPVRVSLYSGESEPWDNYVDTHPAGTIYHRQDWRKVIERTYGFGCPYLIARREAEIVGILPLTVVKSPFFGTYITSCAFSDFGGICADDHTTAGVLLEEAISISQMNGAASLELRHVLNSNMSNLETHHNKVLSVLKLTDSDEALMKLFKAKLRNQIRRSMKNGLTVKWGNKDLLSDFYSVFIRNMRDLGTPAPGIDYFRNVVEFHGNAADVLVIYKDDMPISAAVGLSYRGTMEVPWASSIRKYFSLLPNMFLYWTLLQKCVARQLEYFSFGRSTTDSPTYKFKAQWNSEQIILNYQTISFSKELQGNLTPGNPKYDMAIKLWKKLPVVLAKKIGPFVAKGLA